MEEEKWAQRIASEISERGENKKREDVKLIIEYDLKKAHAPKFWEETRDAIKRKVELLNKTLDKTAMTWLSTKASEVIVGFGDEVPAQATASFDPKTLRIETSAFFIPASYHPIIQNGAVVFKADTGAVQTPDQIAERFVSDAAKHVKP